MLQIPIFVILIHTVSPLRHDSRETGFVDGHIMIGAMFSIHHSPSIENSYNRQCGEIREEYGMHRVEVLLKTIAEINNSSTILPGIKLGVDIRDTCWNGPIALEQSVDFIKNSIKNHDRSHMITNTGRSSEKAIVGLIGPASSAVSIQVQNMLQLFHIPQIGFSATAIDLSRVDDYKYYIRVVPSDKLQVKALMDLIQYFEWKYLSLVNTKGNYGTQGKKELKVNLSEKKDICIDQDLEIEGTEKENIKDIANKLFTGERAKVVICYCDGDVVSKLLRTMVDQNMTNQGFLIIGTDGWADRMDVLGKQVNKTNNERQLSNAALGSITIRLHSEKLKDFDDYFRSKTFESTDGNPWFQEFWEHKFQCHVNATVHSKFNRTCYGNESLYDKEYKQDSKLGFIVKSIMTIALGLHKLLKCNSHSKHCENPSFINGTLLLKELRNLSFQAYDNETVSFDEKGDPPGWYDIMNYGISLDTNGRKMFKYERIGTWKNASLTIQPNLTYWPNPDSTRPIRSFCSANCMYNQIRIFQRDLCCWKCSNCTEYQRINISTMEERCIDCPTGTMPTSNRSTCVNISAIHIQWSHPSSIIAATFASFGIIATAVITVILARFNDTPVVKSSTRELMYVILAGITMSYLTTFALLTKPGPVSCLLSRIMPGLSLSLIYGSLVTKTNRICRILAISKKKIIRRRSRFLTTTAQLVIVLILNVIVIVIIAALTVVFPPGPTRSPGGREIVYLICSTPTTALFIPLGFDAVLVCFCTWYAFKTRKLPENFNEAKFIGFTMYTTCIIWIGFVITYFGSSFKFISLCFAISLSASVVIALLFMPKVYIILFRPQKNERAAFTTTTEIRCHIGPGKKDNKVLKEKFIPTKSNSKQTLKCPTDPNNVSVLKGSQGEYTDDGSSYRIRNCHTHLDHEFPNSHSEKQTKLTQTELSLISEFLFNLLDSLETSSEDDLNITQLSLLNFLKENWNRENIPPIYKFNRTYEPKTGILCDEEMFVDDYEDHISEVLPSNEGDVDNNSLQQPIPKQTNTTVTCSPISNVSTDASSTINTMFLDYLQMHGKIFRSPNKTKSAKL